MTLAALVLAQCFVVNDASPGWKQVALPASAPHLAAPEGVEQFRTTDPATLTYELADTLRTSSQSGLGRQTFEFGLPRDTRTLTVRFGRALDSAKVDVVVEGPRGRQVLLDERRVSGAVLALAVPLPEANRALVTVHTHLRGAVALDSATVERAVRPQSTVEFPERLRLENSLYVLSRGEPLTLCERPSQPMVVSASALQTPVRAVSVTPLP